MDNNQMQTERYTHAKAMKYGKNGWRAYLEYTENGKRKQRTRKLVATGRTDKAELAANIEAADVRRAANAAYLEQLKEGIAQGQTVADYLSAFIAGREIAIEKSTAAEYRRIAANLVSPEFGALALVEVTPDDVQAWINSLSKEYAPATVRKALVLIRSMFSQAVERDVMTKNPARTVKGPQLAQRKPNALDERGRAKVAAFIALDPSTPLNIGFALALYLGLREGEVCGLQWRYVDLKAKTIAIEKTIGHDKDQKGGSAKVDYLKTPKTGGSRRMLPIPDVLIEPLTARRRECRADAMKMGLKLDDMFVTGKADGTHMQAHYLSTRWRKAADVLELVGTEGKRPTFHDLRHTFATAAITNGIDVKTVSSIMGHANAAMTLNIYASADEDAKRRGVDALAAAIAAETEKHRSDGQVISIRATKTVRSART